MANDYTDEEKARLVNEWHENLEKGLPITKRQSEAMEEASDSTSEAKKRIEEMNAAYKKMGKGVKDWTKSMYDGQQGMSAMNGSVDAAAGALELIIALIPGFGLLKVALTATVGAVAAYAKAANEQADALFKTYQDLSKNGMATAGGMTEIYKNMQQFGYGIKELGQMTELLKENSEALANFGGTAAQGTQIFANAANEIQHSDIGKTFQMMGKTPDEINRGIALFIKSQQGIGIKSSEIQKDLTARSAEYIRQLDIMSKLTGQSAEQLQAKLDTANAESAFNQVQYELQQKADAGDKKAEKQIAENQKLAEMYAGTEFGKELFQGVGGDVSAMTKTMMTAPEVVALIQKGDYTAAQIQNALARGSKQFRDSYGNLLKMNAGGFGLPVKELSASVTRFGDETAEQQEEMARAQQKLQEKGLDPMTKKMVELRIEQQKTRDSLQNFVNKGLGTATTALKAFADVANSIAGVVPGTDSEAANQKNQIGGTTPSATEPTPSGGKATPSGGKATLGPNNSININSEIRSGGDRNWRSNNPGNITYGDFAISMGAIGSDGRFAIFPSEEMGRRAADTLLKGNAYSKLSAADAIKKWAPPNENDSGAYIKNVAKMANLDMTKRYADMSTAEQGRFLDAMKTVEGGHAGTVTPSAPTGTTKQTKFTGPITEPLTPSAPTGTTKQTKFTGPITEPLSGAIGLDAMLSGPLSGYKPNLTMHGTEQLKITPKNNDTQFANSGTDAVNTIMSQQLEKIDRLVQIVGDQSGTDIMSRQIDKLDELVRAMQNQVNVSTKILQAAR